eukprot:tig00022080_g23793.t1
MKGALKQPKSTQQEDPGPLFARVSLRRLTEGLACALSVPAALARLGRRPTRSARRELSYVTERTEAELLAEAAEREKKRAHTGWLCSIGTSYVPFGPPDLHLRYSKKFTRRQSQHNAAELLQQQQQQQEAVKKKKAMIRGRDDLIFELEEYLAEEEVEDDGPMTTRGGEPKTGYVQLWQEIRGSDLRRKKCRAGKSVLEVTRVSLPASAARQAAAAAGENASESPPGTPLGRARRGGGAAVAGPRGGAGTEPPSPGRRGGDQSRPSTSGDPSTGPHASGGEDASDAASIVSRVSRASRRTISGAAPLGPDGQPVAVRPHPPRHAQPAGGHATIATARLPGQSLWPPRWEKSLERFVENVVAPSKAAAARGASPGASPGKKKKKGRDGEIPDDLFPPTGTSPGDVVARRREFAERRAALDLGLLRAIQKMEAERPTSMMRRLQAVDHALQVGGGGAALALHARQMDLSARAAALSSNAWWPKLVKMVFEKKANGTRPTAIELRLLKQIKKDLEEGEKFTANKLYGIVLGLSLREQLSERVQYFINELREVAGIPPKTWRTWLDKNELPVPNFLLVLRDPALEEPRGSLQPGARRSRLASVASIARSADAGPAPGPPPALDGASLQRAVSRLEGLSLSGAHTAR